MTSGSHETLHPTFLHDTKHMSFVFPVIDLDVVGPTKYTDLCATLYRNLMDDYRGNASESGAISHGFKMVGKITAHAPVAYTEYAGREGVDPSAEELSVILLRSFETAIKPLAATDNRRNAILEAHLGLIGGNNAAAYEVATINGRPYYRPRPLELSFAEEEIDSRTVGGSLEEQSPTRRCLALPYVLPTLWSTIVNGCAAHSKYFDADIQAILNETVQA
jgi:hypothetical protein